MKPATKMALALAATLGLALGMGVSPSPVASQDVGGDVGGGIFLRGTVTGLDWSSPHVTLRMRVSERGRAPRTWVVVAGSPDDLLRNRISRTTLHVGAAITVQATRTGPCRPMCSASAQYLVSSNARDGFMGSSGTGAPFDPEAPRFMGSSGTGAPFDPEENR
jgi:hypothetical protein